MTNTIITIIALELVAIAVLIVLNILQSNKRKRQENEWLCKMIEQLRACKKIIAQTNKISSDMLKQLRS